MTSNIEQVRSIFMAALERPADQWTAYLAEACGTDTSLREQVDVLLQAHQSGRGMLDTPTAAFEQMPAPTAYEKPNLILAGKYKLIERIGDGGMGSVWLAQQSEPMKRKVAVKLIKLGMDSRQVLQRFEAERQALAMMDHPNIAKVLDGGLTPDGRPFFVMELVKGTPITDYCDAFKLSLKQRLELFVPVCQAIQHAHQKGIIHRDIKPSNVIIALYDDRPVPKVIDFGVAKATGESLSSATLNTAFGGVIGTPQYMSPEQATLNNLDIDTRSDVYSLGVLLYELLTGEPPFTKKELEKKGLMEVLRVVREDEPPKPSTRLSSAAALPTLSANRSAEPRKLAQMLRSELDWIVLKALEKNRSRRYETANGLAADVQRYLSDEPVTAHPPGAAYLMSKFFRRHLAQVAAAAVLALALLAGIAGTTYGLIRARTQTRIAQKHEAQAEASRHEADQARTLADTSRARAEVDSYNATLGEARALRGGHEPGWREKALNDLTRLATMPSPRRDLSELRTEVTAALTIPDISLITRLDLAPGGVFHDRVTAAQRWDNEAKYHDSFAFSSDGQTLYTAHPATGLDAWDSASGRHLYSSTTLTVAAARPDNPNLLVCLPDGRGMAMGTPGDGIIYTDTRGVPSRRPPTTRPTSRPDKLALSSDGKRVAVAWSTSDEITIHDAFSDKLLSTLRTGSKTFAFSADGQWIAYAQNLNVLLWPVGSDQKPIVLDKTPEMIRALNFSPDGHTLAVASGDDVALFDLAKRAKSKVLQGHRARTTDVAFSPDSKRIATCSRDYTLRVWEAQTGECIATLPTYGSPAFGVKWSPNGEYLAAIENNIRQVFLYKMTGRQSIRQWLAGGNRELVCIAAHPSLEEITTCGFFEVNRWDLTASPVSALGLERDPGGAILSLAYSPDGSRIATASWEYNTKPVSRQILVRDANTGTEQIRINVAGIVQVLAFDPKGGRLAYGDAKGEITLYDLATKDTIWKYQTGTTVRSICFLDNPRRLLTHGRNALLLLNIDSGKLERTVDLASGALRKFTVDREQKRLVMGFESGEISSMSLPDFVPGPHQSKAHDGGVHCLALSPDGRLLASAGDDCRVKLFDPNSLQLLLEFPLWPGSPQDLTFDSTSHHLAIVGHPREVDLWDISTLRDGLTRLGLAWNLHETADASSKSLSLSR